MDAGKKWVFEEGYMTCYLQNQARTYYATHTYEEGDHLSCCMGIVLDPSWCESQLCLDPQ